MTDLLDDRLCGCKTPTVTVDVSLQSQKGEMRSADQCAGGPKLFVLQDDTKVRELLPPSSVRESHHTKQGRHTQDDKGSDINPALLMFCKTFTLNTL